MRPLALQYDGCGGARTRGTRRLRNTILAWLAKGKTILGPPNRDCSRGMGYTEVIPCSVVPEEFRFDNYDCELLTSGLGAH